MKAFHRAGAWDGGERGIRSLEQIQVGLAHFLPVFHPVGANSFPTHHKALVFPKGNILAL